MQLQGVDPGLRGSLKLTAVAALVYFWLKVLSSCFVLATVDLICHFMDSEFCLYFFFTFSLNIFFLKFLVHCDSLKYSEGLPAKPVLPHRLLLSVAAQCVPDEVCLMKESNFTISGVCFCNLSGAGLFLQSLRNYFQESNVLSDVISVCVCVFVAYTNLLIKHIVELCHSCGNTKQVNTKSRPSHSAARLLCEIMKPHQRSLASRLELGKANNPLAYK